MHATPAIQGWEKMDEFEEYEDCDECERLRGQAAEAELQGNTEAADSYVERLGAHVRASHPD
jgi:hypothetical protein